MSGSNGAVVKKRRFCGLEGWAPFFWPGVMVGFTPYLANVAPSASLVMVDRRRAGDHFSAMSIWRQAQPFEAQRARNRSANVSVFKEALARLGRRRRAVRPPI